MKICGRKDCNNKGVYKNSQYSWYCVLCTWINNRRTFSKRRNKYTPPWAELYELVVSYCPHCNRKMHYERGGNMKLVATLQHYDDGTIGVICHSCNSAHGPAKRGDNWQDVPEGHKWCPKCDTVQEVNGFTDNPRTRDGLRSICRACNNAHAKARYIRLKART